MRAKLRDGLKAALKAKDNAAVAALRSALAAIDNAEAIPADHLSNRVTGDEQIAGSAVGVGAGEAARRHLTEDDLRAIVEGEIRERVVAAQEYEQLGRIDLAKRLQAEADVLSRYLA